VLQSKNGIELCPFALLRAPSGFNDRSIVTTDGRPAGRRPDDAVVGLAAGKLMGTRPVLGATCLPSGMHGKNQNHGRPRLPILLLAAPLYNRSAGLLLLPPPATVQGASGRP
jgi:hypothetical protein